MKVGLMGIPGAGVTTIFCLLTGRDYQTLSTNTKIEINLGETKVPDSRLEKLAEIFNPKRVVNALIEFADVPVELEANGSFSAKTVSNLRNMDALALVVRGFENGAVLHPHNSIDPLRDLNEACDEAILTDLIQIETRLERLGKEGRLKSQEGEFFTRMKAHLENSQPLRTCAISPEELKSIQGYRFLTIKPWLIIINTGSPQTIDTEPVTQECERLDFPWLKMSGQMELEISMLSPEEQIEFMKDLGFQSNAKDRFIRGAYKYLDLISFLTVGEDECRAWSISRGSDAVTAAGKIHTDLARGFIRADVIAYEDFMQFKSLALGRKAGKLRLEGKNYIVQDGDIMDVRFSV